MRGTGRVSLAAFLLGWAAVRRLPERAAYALFRTAADVVWVLRPAGVRRLERNLRRAVGTTSERLLRELVRDGMRSYLRYWCDVMRLPDWDHERTVGTVRCEHEHRLRDPLAAGRGVVAVLPHMGNWDHAGAWATRTGAPVTTVAERLRPEALFRRFVAFRESLGMEVLPLTGGSDPVPVLAERLRQGGFVPLLGDRVLTGRGVVVDLLGGPATMPPGPALLALRTGAVLLPVTTWWDGRTLVITLHEPVEPPAEGSLRDRVAAMTQRVADVFSAEIRAHPQDWHMLQPLSPADVARTGARGAA